MSAKKQKENIDHLDDRTHGQSRLTQREQALRNAAKVQDRLKGKTMIQVFTHHPVKTYIYI